ncbi:MAG: hypothetical protein OEV92_09010 [Nitrospinota bacterium]|nr:hypothetical protein [Nitrospinota bacterium]
MEKRYSLEKMLREIEEDKKVIEGRKGFWVSQEDIRKLVAERAKKPERKNADEK